MKLLVLLLIPSIAFSQRIASDTKDEFSGTRMITTKPEVLKGAVLSNHFSVMGAKTINEGDSMISLLFKYQAPLTTSTDNTTEVLLKFSNGEVLTLNNAAPYDIVTAGTLAWIYCILSDEERETITANEVEKIRVKTSSITFDIDVPIKKRQALSGILRIL